MKTTYESNDRPLNVDDACHRLVEEEMASRQKRWFKFRDLLIEAGLVIPIEEWPIPTDWGSKNVNLIYAHLHEQINWSLDKIRNSSNPMTPQDVWESLLPEVFSFDLGHFAFRPMETYDDGIYRTVTLTDGSAINISKSSDSSYITYPPRDECVAALEEYIREGVRISKQIDSTSNRTWRKADAIFRKHRTLIDLPTSYRAMMELGDLLHDARIELTLDIEDYIATQEKPMSKKPLASGDFRKELERQLACAGSDIAQLSDFREELLSKRASHFCAYPFYQLSLGVVDTIFNILDAADFYAGQRQIEFNDTPAIKMEGLIATLDSERGDPRNLARYSRDSGIDNHLLPLALYALFALLERLCEGMKERVHGINVDDLSGFFYQFKNASNGKIHGDDSYFTINDFQTSLDRISYDLKNLQSFLRLKEHEIYDQHPEWEVIDPGEDPDTSFDGREDRRNRSAALHAFYEQHGNPLEDFEEMTDLLACRYEFDKPTPASSASDLRPFLASVKGVNLDGEVEESAPWDFSTELKKLLSTPISIEIALPDYTRTPYGENTATLHLNPWIAAAKAKMWNAFNAYCRKREAKLPDGITKELLKKRAAELIFSRRDNEAAITPAQELTKKSENNRKPNRKRKGKGGRPKIGAEDKNDQLRIARNWLKDNPGLKNSQLANHVFDLDRKNPSLHRHGYIPPKDGKRLADTALMKAIRDDKEIKAIRDEQKRVKAQ